MNLDLNIVSCASLRALLRVVNSYTALSRFFYRFSDVVINSDPTRYLPPNTNSRYCATPNRLHWTTALGILGHVKPTSSFGIAFDRGTVRILIMQVCADADHASMVADKRSVSGRLLMCGSLSVSWLSRSRKCVTRLITEAEYVVLANVTNEVLFLRQIWRFSGLM